MSDRTPPKLRLFRGGLEQEQDRSSTPVTDEVGLELVRRWRSGDARAFRDLFETYRGLVHGVLYPLFRSDPELEDVVQNAFVEVFRSLDSFEGRSKLSSWVARVALYVGYRHLRRRRKRPVESFESTPEHADDSALRNPERWLESREVKARVYAVLNTLPPKKRSVFILNDLQGLPQEEVAEILDIGVATVRTRLFYARQAFWQKAQKDPVLSEIFDFHD